MFNEIEGFIEGLRYISRMLSASKAEVKDPAAGHVAAIIVEDAYTLDNDAVRGHKGEKGEDMTRGSV